MPENVVLRVELNGAEAAIGQLSTLDSLVKSLKGNKNIKISVSGKSLSTAAQNAQQLNDSLTRVSTAAKNLGTTGAKSIGTAGESLQKASKNAESFRNGMGNVVGTMAKFRLASAAINLVANAFKEALTEIKAVDKEMVNVQKVTGFSATQMKALEKNAYALATQYGRAASEVMEASTVFARAGYTDQIEQLSELSLLLQNVGDLNAEDASKFIIATDKAYGLAGSYEDLIKVIDGLDNITNKNATDMQKMTEGMTIAGSVFSQSGESIETFAAMLGVATANTQRSGSEMARGLRTILMNIRQIRGETEDGELIDGESIANAAKALKEYANISTMENGQLRKSSDVLEELAQKWDLLEDFQRSAIAEAVAGKRQANVLYALMGDWGSYKKMLEEYQTAAGTAAKENEIYLNSWEAKTQQLSAAWTELISGLTDTDFIKGTITGATELIKTLNTLIQSPFFQSVLTEMGDAYKKLWDIPLEIINAESDIIGMLTDTSGKRVLEAKEAALKSEQTAANLLKSYETDFGDGSRYQELLKNVQNLNEAEKVELGLLELQRQEREKSLELAREAAEQAAQKVEAEQKALEANRTLKGSTSSSMFSLNRAGVEFARSGDVNNYLTKVEEALSKGAEYYAQLQQIKKTGGELYDSEVNYMEAYELAAKTFMEGGNSVEMYGKFEAAIARSFGYGWDEAAQQANERMEAFTAKMQNGEFSYDIPVEVIGAATAEDEIARIREEAERGATMVVDLTVVGAGLSASLRKGLGFARGTRSAPGGPAVVNERGPELISANGLAWIAGGGRPTVTMLPKGATVLTAEQTRRATGGSLSGVLPAFEGGTGGSAYTPLTGDDLKPKETEQYPSGRTVKIEGTAVWGEDEKGKRRYQRGKATISNTNTAGGGSSAPAAPNFKALEGDLSDLLKNLDLQAQLAENEEDYVRAMEIYGQAQDAIATLLEQYRAAGYAEDSNEILTLANKGYGYASKQLKDYDTLRDRLIDALEDLTKATEDANELAEKQAAVDKAREALANAQKQRTVRVFNPVTGQWEWIANAEDVNRAQENLAKAEEALQKEELDQAIDAIKNANGADLSGFTLSPAILEKFVSGTPEQQAAFISALNGATGGADYLGSEAGQTAFNQGSTTNIGAQYNLAGITLTDQMANGMTIAQLLMYLQSLKIM